MFPADHSPAVAPPGPLASALLRVRATAPARVETIVDRYAPPASDQFGEAGSLGADADVRDLADALDSAGTDTAAFSTDVFRYAHAGGALLPYRAVATGAGAERDDVFIAIALAMPDAAAAADQARRLRAVLETGSSEGARRPWSDLLHLERIDTQGRVVLAVVTTTVPTLWLSLEREPDTLLWWNPT